MSCYWKKIIFVLESYCYIIEHYAELYRENDSKFMFYTSIILMFMLDGYCGLE